MYTKQTILKLPASRFQKAIFQYYHLPNSSLKKKLRGRLASERGKRKEERKLDLRDIISDELSDLPGLKCTRPFLQSSYILLLGKYSANVSKLANPWVSYPASDHECNFSCTNEIGGLWAKLTERILLCPQATITGHFFQLIN